MSKENPQSLETLLIRPDPVTRALAAPIYQTALTPWTT